MPTREELEQYADEQIRAPIAVFASGEKLDCLRCGKEYISRGKHDPGYCRDCERQMQEESAGLVGGPLGKV